MEDFWPPQQSKKKKKASALNPESQENSNHKKALDGKAVAESTLHDLLASNASLFESGEHSDLTIVCGESQFKVHRAIVGPRSKALGRMCQQGDGAFEEALTGRIHLEHDDPMIVEKMLSFLYRLDYSDYAPYENWQEEPIKLFAPSKDSSDRQKNEIEQANGGDDTQGDHPFGALAGGSLEVQYEIPVPDPPSDNEASPSSPTIQVVASDEFEESDKLTPLVLNARVYTIAEKYDIWALKKLAQHKFEQRVKGNGWNDEGFSLAIREVFEWTTDKDKGLRHVLVHVAAKNVKALRDRGEFKSVLDDIPDFTRRLLDEVLKRKY